VYTFGGSGRVSPDDAFTVSTGTTVRIGDNVCRLLRGGFGILLKRSFYSLLNRPRGVAAPCLQANLQPRHGSVHAICDWRLNGPLCFNVGGGVNYQVPDSVAVRVEFRGSPIALRAFSATSRASLVSRAPIHFSHPTVAELSDDDGSAEGGAGPVQWRVLGRPARVREVPEQVNTT